MAIFKSVPSIRIINGNEIKTSDSAVISNAYYKTNGEYVIVVKDINFSEIELDKETTDHIVIKSLTNVIVKSNNLIDEKYNEVELDNGSCVEFKFIGDFWYILSSDGLKND